MTGANRRGKGYGAPYRPGLVASYKPPGPKAAAFVESDAPITVIIGPEGSGKTMAACQKMLWAAQQQAPSPHDGVVRVKGYIIRSTYRDLWDKSIPSYRQFWGEDPPGAGWEWTGGKGEPATHIIRLRIPDPTAPGGLRHYELIHEFRAIGDANIDDFVAGLEPTWVYCNEVNTLPKGVLSKLYRRCGRYPAPHDRPKDGVIRWFGLFADMNPEDENHWTFEELMTAARKDGVRLIQQPSGFSPEAENMASLRQIHPDYYRHKAASMEPWEVARMIEGKWGYNRDGQPVYADDWVNELHSFEDEIEPDPNLPIWALVDAGGRPALVWCQQTRDGTMVLFDELTTADNDFADVETFARRAMAQKKERYPKLRVAGFIPDPSANARLVSASQDIAEEDRTWIRMFWLLTGWPPTIPTTNDLNQRVRAVRRRLRAGPKGLRVSPRCKVVRAGFNSGYKMRKVGADGTATELRDRIVKNRYSHPHDAVQYGALVLPLPPELVTEQDLEHLKPPLPYSGAETGHWPSHTHAVPEVIRD